MHLSLALYALAAASDPAPNTTLRGIVQSADGRPISGAVVRITRSDSVTVSNSSAATTASDGRYVIRATVPLENGHVLGVTVHSRDFVPLDESYEKGPHAPTLRRGKETDLNFVLARGDILSGTLDLRPSGMDRLAGRTSEGMVATVRVRGPSYSHLLQVTGREFETYVPPGTYSLELLHGLEKLPAARLDGIAAGTRNLRLAVPYPKVLPAVAAKAYDALGADMASRYSHFSVKKVDWPAALVRHRAAAAAAEDLKKFVDALQDLLAELRDGHVSIEWPGGTEPAALPPDRAGNQNQRVTVASLTDVARIGEFAVVGRTRDHGFPAIIMTKQSAADPLLVARVVDFVLEHRDAAGFLVDLREANGGDERLARDIATRFCTRDVVYAKHRFRNGPGPADFGDVFERYMQSTDGAFSRPVVVLHGPRTLSSGEGFVQMMKALPHVTTVGARTRGSSGNPARFKLPGVNVTVWYSRWLDLMPNLDLVEDRGIAPDVLVDAPPEAYRAGDPTWEKAIEVLRARVGNKQ